jgi:polo-like kinase 1
VRRYIKGKFLGKGGFAKCFEATNMDTQKRFAIKIINKENLKKAKAKQKVKNKIYLAHNLNKNSSNFETSESYKL